jgi:hypothetical protein
MVLKEFAMESKGRTSGLVGKCEGVAILRLPKPIDWANRLGQDDKV